MCFYTSVEEHFYYTGKSQSMLLMEDKALFVEIVQMKACFITDSLL